MPLGTFEFAEITGIIWFVLIAITGLKLRNQPIEITRNEVPRLVTLAFAFALALGSGIAAVIAVFLPDLVQDRLGSLIAPSLIGAGVLVWFTYAEYWLSLKTMPRKRQQRGRKD